MKYLSLACSAITILRQTRQPVAALYALVLLVLSPQLSPVYAASYAQDTEKADSGQELKAGFLALLSEKERAWIRANPVIRIGVDPAFPPFEFLVEGERLQGISSDYLAAIERRTGLKMEVQQGLVWSDVIRKARRREIDLLPSILYSAERQIWLQYSNSYVSYQRAVIVKDVERDIRSVKDLAGLRIGVQAASLDVRYVQNMVPGSTVVEFNTFANSLIKLENGEIDAVIGNGPSSLYYARQLGIEGLKIVSVTDSKTYPLYMGARKDWPELASIVNKVLDQMSDAEKTAILDRWSTPVLSERVDYSLIWKTLAATFPVVLLILAWAFYAQRQNRTLARTQEELVQASRLASQASEAKTTFLSNMSHEMRTPLTSILGFLRLIIDEKPGGEVERNAQTAEQSARDLLQLVNDILDISRLESGSVVPELEAINLPDLVSRVMDHLRPIAERKRLYMQTRYTGEPFDWIMMDEKLLRQILINLLGNAVKFTETGGVTLELVFERMNRQDMLTVKIHDTGVGIRDKDLGRILDRFERVENQDGMDIAGTGIGLALCRDLARAMGGDISVTSIWGEGSTFSVRLPVVQAEALEAEAESLERNGINPDAPVIPGGIRVRVADDNAVNRMLLKKILGKQGFKVELFGDGKEILDQMREDADQNGCPACDMVLMDVNMPIMNGLEAQRKIRHLGPLFDQLPIIAVSANAIQSDMDRYLSEGMTDYVTKPIHQEELLEAIMRHYRPA